MHPTDFQAILLVLCIALGLTALVEVVVAAILGLRGRSALLAVVLVNFVTNPALNLLVHSNRNYMGAPNHTIIIVGEVVVVAVEAFLLAYALGLAFKRALFVSLAMNVVSMLVGIVLLGSL